MERKLNRLIVYSEAIELSVFVRDNLYEIIAPHEYEMKSQLMRSLISIPSNIGEGAWSGTEKNFLRYLNIAIGSAAELYTQVELCQRFGWAREEVVRLIQKKLEKLSAQMLALKKRIELCERPKQS